MPEMKILFFHLDAGFCNPQNGQTASERLISLRQPGQSREFFWLLFDIFVCYPNILTVVEENIYLTVTNTRNFIAWEASVGKLPVLFILRQWQG
jgi:hypothetical protein